MARGRRNGVAIAGGGLAGCLAALALARLRPDVPLIIVEERERFGGDGLRTLFDAALDEEEAAFAEPLLARRWPGFFLAFPGFSRKIRAPWSAFDAGALHETMLKALKPRQYRLGTRVVAVRDDGLELDGGETIRAEGAIDARGGASLSMLDLLHETRIERDYVLAAPHGLDRPVLVDATAGLGGLRYIRCLPAEPDRLTVAEVELGDRVQADPAAEARLDAYVAARGWRAERVEGQRSVARPLPFGGDFAAFWRLGGARAARLGPRGGFLHPATGRTAADAVRTALLLARQRDFSGPALHAAFERAAQELWRERAALRAATGRFAATAPERRMAAFERLYRLDAGLIGRFHAGRLGLVDRLRLARALRG